MFSTLDILLSVAVVAILIVLLRTLVHRRRAVQALRVAEERMRFALAAAGVGIWDMDYATGVAW
jgi:PAS domain-containing protein